MSSEFVPFLKGDFDARQHKIYNLPEGVDPSDAATVSQLGGGGSQTVEWIGPYPFTYQSFPDFAYLDLGDAPAGKLLVAGAIFVSTAFNDSAAAGGGVTLNLGDPDGSPSQVLPSIGSIDLRSASAPDAAGNVVGLGPAYFILGTDSAPTDNYRIADQPALIGNGTPNKLLLYGGNLALDGTTGAADLYLCFATPVAP